MQQYQKRGFTLRRPPRDKPHAAEIHSGGYRYAQKLAPVLRQGEPAEGKHYHEGEEHQTEAEWIERARH